MLKNFRSYHLAVSLYRLCQKESLPHREKDQLLRASLSIVLNLAEGSARPSKKDRLRFYSIAFASCREVQAILMLIANDELFRIADHLGGALYRLHRS